MTGTEITALAVAAVGVFWMVGAYNRLVRGVELAFQRKSASTATFVLEHPDGIMTELASLATCEAIRIGLLASGCHVAVVQLTSATPTRTQMHAHWG